MGKRMVIPEGMEWATAFVDEIAFERSYAKRTAQKTLSALIQWLCYVGPSYGDFCSAAPEDAAGWAEHRCDEVAATTVHNEISHLRTLYGKALELEDALCNPFDGLDIGRDSQSKMAEAVTPAEIRRLLSVAKERCPKSDSAKLDYALLCLRVRCGASSAELSRTTAGDYVRQGDTGLLRLTTTFGESYVAFVDRESTEALESYLATRRDLPSHAPMFAKTRGTVETPQTERGIDRRISNAFERAGLRVGNRSMKRGMLELAQESGASDAELVMLSRNLSPSLVARIAVEDQRASFLEAWERLRMGVDDERPLASATLSRSQIVAALSNRAAKFELSIDSRGCATIRPVGNGGRRVDQKRAEMVSRRAELGLTQEQAAKAIGIAHGTWNKMETGACDVSAEVAPRIEKLLGMEFTYGVESIDLSGIDESAFLKCSSLIGMARQIAEECRNPQSL